MPWKRAPCGEGSEGTSSSLCSGESSRDALFYITVNSRFLNRWNISLCFSFSDFRLLTLESLREGGARSVWASSANDASREAMVYIQSIIGNIGTELTYRGHLVNDIAASAEGYTPLTRSNAYTGGPLCLDTA